MRYKCEVCNFESPWKHESHWASCSIKSGKRYIRYNGKVLVDIENTPRCQRSGILGDEFCFIRGNYAIPDMVMTYSQCQKIGEAMNGK